MIVIDTEAVDVLRDLYSKLIYMLCEGLSTKQDLFKLIANVTLRHKHTLFYRLQWGGVASLTIQSRYAYFQVLSSFISLEIDCFHSQ